MNIVFTIEDAENQGFHGNDALYFAAFMNAVMAKVSNDTALPFSALPAWDWVAAYHTYEPVEKLVHQYLKEILP